MRRSISPRAPIPPHRAAGPTYRAGLALVVAAVIATFAGVAHAQDTTAEAVFEEGVKLFEAGNYAAACPKLKSAVKLSTSEALGGRLLLAECYEKQGKWASAWALYRELVGKAATAGQQGRREKAEAGQARVEPKLARLKIELAESVAAVPGLALDHDGEAMPREAWDIALPVDPGTVIVTATAPGKRAARVTVQIEDAPTTKSVRIERMEDEPAGAPPPDSGPPPPPAPSGSTEPPPPPPAKDEGGIGGLGIAGLVLGGTGLVGIGVSAIVAAGAKSSWDDAVAARDGQGVEDAQGTGNAATGVFVAGAVLTAVGTTLVVIDLTSTKADASGSAWRLRTAGLGARAEGRF